MPNVLRRRSILAFVLLLAFLGLGLDSPFPSSSDSDSNCGRALGDQETGEIRSRGRTNGKGSSRLAQIGTSFKVFPETQKVEAVTLNTRYRGHDKKVTLYRADLHGIRGYFLNLERQINLRKWEFGVFLELLRGHEVFKLADDEVALAFHVQGIDPKTSKPTVRVFWVFDLMKFKNPATQKKLLRAYMNLPRSFLRFVFKQYIAHKTVGDDKQTVKKTIRRLWSISSEVKNRTLLLLSTQDSFVQIKGDTIVFPSDHFPDPLSPDVAYGDFGPGEVKRMHRNLQILGGAAAVFSFGEDQVLPLERMHPGVHIERPSRAGIVEIGRYSIIQDRRSDLTPAVVREVAATIAGLGDIEKVIIDIVDKAKVTVYKERYGFKLIHEFHDPKTKLTEYILEAPIEVFLRKSLGRR